MPTPAPSQPTQPTGYTPTPSAVQPMDMPTGLFSKGFFFGLFIFFMANVFQPHAPAAFVNTAYPMLFPAPLMRMGKDVASSVITKSCDAFLNKTYEYVDEKEVYFCEGAPNGTKMLEIATKIWFYFIVGFYYGLLFSILIRLYVVARNRMDW
jgi:hypothetical protein